jgi:hypothetical protein
MRRGLEVVGLLALRGMRLSEGSVETIARVCRVRSARG